MPAKGQTKGATVPCSQCGEPVYSFPSHIRKFCSFQCRSDSYKGRGNPHWRGGRCVDREGYVYIHKPDHPFANKDGYVFEHRLVMESLIGRLLTPDEEVHHINEIKGDNRPENLELMAGSAEHRRRHSAGSIELACALCGERFVAPLAAHRRKPRLFCGSVCTAKNSARALWARRKSA